MTSKSPNPRRGILATVLLGALLAAYLAGAYSGVKKIWPVEALHGLRTMIFPDPPVAVTKPSDPRFASFDPLGRLSGYPGKVEVACPVQTGRTAVLLIIGQSNSANHGGQRYAPPHGGKVVNFFDGRCYIAASPLLGASGIEGEPWTLLGSRLVAAGLADHVVLIPAGIKSTPVRRWQDGADLNLMLRSVLNDAKARFRITGIIWHQGESDFIEKTPPDTYMAMVASLVDSIRRQGVDAPFFRSVATRCGIDPGWTWTPDNPIAIAQKSLRDEARNIRPGIDTDALLDSADRYDDCHFSGSALEKSAEAWSRILFESAPPAR